MRTGCQTGGQNCNGVQGIVLQSSLQPYTDAVVYEFVLLCVILDYSINICNVCRKEILFS